jgi:hypothetical protein
MTEQLIAISSIWMAGVLNKRQSFKAKPFYILNALLVAYAMMTPILDVPRLSAALLLVKLCFNSISLLRRLVWGV